MICGYLLRLENNLLSVINCPSGRNVPPIMASVLRRSGIFWTSSVSSIEPIILPIVPLFLSLYFRLSLSRKSVPCSATISLTVCSSVIILARSESDILLPSESSRVSCNFFPYSDRACSNSILRRNLRFAPSPTMIGSPTLRSGYLDLFCWVTR